LFTCLYSLQNKYAPPAFLFQYPVTEIFIAFMKNPTKIFFFFIAISYTIFYVITAMLG